MRTLLPLLLALAVVPVAPGCTYIWGEPSGGPDDPGLFLVDQDEEQDLGGYTRDEIAELLDASWYGETLVSNDTFVLRDAPCYENAASPDGWDTIIITFSCPAADIGLRAGQVLVGTEGRGFLRRVEEVDFSGFVAVARTTQAALEDVWYVADFATGVRIDPFADAIADDLEREVELSLPEGWTFHRMLYEGGGGDADTGWEAMLEAEGLLYVIPTLYMDADIGLDFGWSLPPVSVEVNKVEAGVVFEATAEIVLHGRVDGWWTEEGDVDLFEFGRDFVFPGPAGIPIVAGMDFEVELTWLAEASGSIDATIGAHADARFGLGGKYEDGDWELLDDWDWDAAMIGPEVDIEGEFFARAGIKITVSANIYGGVLEFGASGEPWIGPELGLDCDAVDWELLWGVDTSAHVGGLWGVVPDYEFDLVNFGPYSLASGEVDLPLDFLPDPDCTPEDSEDDIGGEDEASDSTPGSDWWVEDFGDVDVLEPGNQFGTKWYGFDATPQGDGYWMVDVDGRIATYGAAQHFGEFLEGDEPVEAVVGHPTGDGYWILAADGTVYAYGDARIQDSNTSDPISAAIVGIAPHPGGSGYWTLGADGVVHGFGDSARVGQPADLGPRNMAVDIEPTPSGSGYWIVGFDGAVHAFGDAAHLGDAEGEGGWTAFVAMEATSSGDGYWLATADGRVFAFGGAPDLGDLRGSGNAEAIMELVSTPSGQGYWLVTWDGSVHAFGDAEELGQPAS